MTELRLKELKAYYDFCGAQTDTGFLLIPSEEANVHYGGHWAVAFPKPVYWYMAPPESKSSVSEVPGYGTVYTIGSANALLDMMRREQGFAVIRLIRERRARKYSPTKFDIPSTFSTTPTGATGWKQMPADMSSPRLGERSLKLLDDMSNWGLRKETACRGGCIPD